MTPCLNTYCRIGRRRGIFWTFTFLNICENYAICKRCSWSPEVLSMKTCAPAIPIFFTRCKPRRGTDIYLLIEHQSSADRHMAFRLMRYAIAAMQRHLDKGHTQLPLVIPLLFYHGQVSPWPYPCAGWQDLLIRKPRGKYTIRIFT
jgi:hypothetical protein